MKFKNNIAVSTSGLIFNPDTGESFSVNPLGSEIINYLKEGGEVQDIGRHITEKYNVDQKTFEKDFDDFVSQLRTYSLIEHEDQANA
ncbi:MAG: PqqD family protein [Bacteroidales bacterium]